VSGIGLGIWFNNLLQMVESLLERFAIAHLVRTKHPIDGST
jgi:hypothetical protein